MIDFASDGPLSPLQPAAHPGHAVIGVGSGGVNVVDQIRLADETARHCYVIDTDEQSIRGSVVEEKFLLGKPRVRGMGCGGDPEQGKFLWEEQELEVAEMLDGLDSAFVILSLGGGTGSGCGPELVKWLKKKGIEVVVMAISPFEFEGNSRAGHAVAALKELRRTGVPVFSFSNNRSLHLPETETDIRLCMHEVNLSLARCCETMRRMVCERGLSQVTWNDLYQLAAVADPEMSCLEATWTGTGEAFGEERVQKVVQEALQSTLLEDGSAWRYADRAFAGLIGGSDFSMSEYQAVIRHLKEDLPDGFPIGSGAIVDTAFRGRIRLMLCFCCAEGNPEERLKEEPGKRDQSVENGRPQEARGKEGAGEPSIHPSDVIPGLETSVLPTAPQASKVDLPLESPAERDRYFTEQEELPLEKIVHRGRFEKSSPTVFDGEDLDQPTFQRLGIVIRL